jgi:N-acetylglucosaminyldiphosphoundecaprenol N-acetyl-beta-D-mannosaminyltransferase
MQAQGLARQLERPPRTDVLGAPVHIVDVQAVLRLMEQWIQQRGPTRWIAVTGSHGALEAHKHPDFREILNSAEVSVPDGRWAARVAARKMSCATHQVRGADLLSAFCRLSREKGYTNYFYGDTTQTLTAARERLTAEHPGLRIIGAYSPPFRPLTAEEDAEVVTRTSAVGPEEARN